MKRFSLVMMVLFGMGMGFSALDPNTVIANLDTGELNTYAQAQLAVLEQTDAGSLEDAKRILDAIIATPYNEAVQKWAEHRMVFVHRDMLVQELSVLVEAKQWQAVQSKYNELLSHTTAYNVASKTKGLIPRRIRRELDEARIADVNASAYALLNQAKAAVQDRNKDLAIEKILAFYQAMNENSQPFRFTQETIEKAKRAFRPVYELVRHAGVFQRRRPERILRTENQYLNPGEVKLSSGRNILNAYRAFHPSLHGYRFMLTEPMTPHPLGRECLDWMQATFYEPYNLKQIDIYNNRSVTAEGVSRIQVGVYAGGRWTNLGQFDIPEGSGEPVTIPVNIENATRVFIEVKQTMSTVSAGISYIGVQIQ